MYDLYDIQIHANDEKATVLHFGDTIKGWIVANIDGDVETFDSFLVAFAYLYGKTQQPTSKWTVSVMEA